ncbi:hypothetical protein [Candidatus Magnetobacterium casense]|uniref:Uncharacterized protein n=1 Tax=Candidatus Magnetobacterium casense TaxID=1455061 RepID=A0ABS6S474_9BACT|nr:hypothetical protein [Candidatus Magnetobacterium casensis]MBV6343654.1 hypothetical protein [Candidatus Magnetobacterium casensis]
MMDEEYKVAETEARIRKDWEALVNLKIERVKSRTAWKRGWVVLRKSWLTSSINYRCTLEEIAVFSKLIVMADEFGPVPGLISDNDLRAMPYEYLSHVACCPLEVFRNTVEKSKLDESIYENGHGIFIIHFDDYQFTEYDRQKKYRQAKRVVAAPNPEKFADQGRFSHLVRR